MSEDTDKIKEHNKKVIMDILKKDSDEEKYAEIWKLLEFVYKRGFESGFQLSVASKMDKEKIPTLH